MTEMLRSPPPGIASSISRGSFRDTRVADNFSPFSSVHEFNAANRQVAPSPFLRGVRPGSLHTSVVNATPKQKGISQALSRRDSMASFYQDPPPGGHHPHPDDVFPHQHQHQPDNQPPFHPQRPPSHMGSPASPLRMNVQAATPRHEPVGLHDDQNSERYGSLYAAPYENQQQHAPTRQQSFQTTGTKLSRKTKASKRSGLSTRRRPPPEASEFDNQSQVSQFQGTPYVHPGDRYPSISEHPTRSPSMVSRNSHIHVPQQATPYLRPRDHPPSSGGVLTRPASTRGRESIYSIPKTTGFPFETEGDDLIARVWLPWRDDLYDHPCKFWVRGINGEDWDLDVDYAYSKMINGIVKIRGGGMTRRDGHGRGRLVVEWEIGFQFEP